MQYEGAYLADGKGLNNWDVFACDNPGSIDGGSNGDIAVDQYHRYLEDIELMVSLGVNSYKFSISWARILPRGKYGHVNLAGIDYYNRLIDALLLKGIEPFVVLSHFDIPQELEDKYGSWLSPKIQEDFEYLAHICFKYFGNRVKYWVTFNEPNVLMFCTYRSGLYPPCRCSNPFGNCTNGDSKSEPLVAAHNIILAHAAAVNLYRTKYQNEQGGSIGITLHALWYVPISESSVDKLAAERAQSFFMNWFLDPIILGKYPVEMKKILGSILPEFSSNDQEKLKTGLDFIGINHYASFYVQDCMFSACEPLPGTSRIEGYYRQTSFKDGVPIGEFTGLMPLHVYPEGMEKIVTYIKERYNNIPMYITENGYCDKTNSSSSLKESLQDDKRVEYMAAYLDALSTAIRKGANVRGYFAWTLLDNFEWLYGYTKRFGLHHVDRITLERTPKLSAAWFKKLIAKHKRLKSLTSYANPTLLQY